MIFGHASTLERPTPGCSYVARIDFDYGDRTYRAGEAFDYLALGLTESQASDLWIAGRLVVAQAAVTKPATVPAPSKRKEHGRG